MGFNLGFKGLILKRNQIGKSGLERFGTGYGHVAGCCEHVNEPLGFVNCWEFLD